MATVWIFLNAEYQLGRILHKKLSWKILGSPQIFWIPCCLGGSTSYTYQATSEYTNEAGELLNADLPSTYNTLRSMTSDNGLGEVATTTYEYADGSFYYADQYDRRFAGFGNITTTNALGETTTTYSHQGNGDDSVSYESGDSFAKMNKPYRSEMRDASGTLIKTTITSWGEDDLGYDNAFVHQDEVVELLYDTSGSHTDTAVSFTYDSTTGNSITKTEYGEVNASEDGSYTDSGDDDRTTTTSYATDATGVITALSSAITLTDTDGTTISQTRYIYDGLAFGSVETGNVTQAEMWISGSDYAASVYTYDAYGNMLTKTDPLGNTTTIAYDSYNLYPATSVNALSQTQTLEYDVAIGKSIRVEEVNGSITETDYDGLGRPTEERRSSTTDHSTRNNENVGDVVAFGTARGFVGTLYKNQFLILTASPRGG